MDIILYFIWWRGSLFASLKNKKEKKSTHTHAQTRYNIRIHTLIFYTWKDWSRFLFFYYDKMYSQIGLREMEVVVAVAVCNSSKDDRVWMFVRKLFLLSGKHACLCVCCACVCDTSFPPYCLLSKLYTVSSLSWVVFFFCYPFECICFFPSFFFLSIIYFISSTTFFPVCCCCSCYFIEKNQVSWMSFNRRVNAVILEGWYNFLLIIEKK